MLKFFDNSRTIAAAVGGALLALGGWLTGEVTAVLNGGISVGQFIDASQEPLTVFLGFMTAIYMRLGIKKAENK